MSDNANTTKRFAARYDGKCCICNARIDRGVMVAYNNGNRYSRARIAHETCYDSAGQQFQTVPLEPKPSAPSTPTLDTLKSDVFDDDKVDYNEPMPAPVEPQGDLGRMLADALNPYIKASVDIKQVRKIVEDGMADVMTTLRGEMHADHAVRIEVVDQKTMEVRDIGKQHKQFAELLQLVNTRDVKGNRLNFWLKGSAGTGKTTAAEAIGRALGFERIVILPKLNDSSMFFGYNVPGTGEYLRTGARDAWEHGGMLILDDFDGTDPNTATELMAPFANCLCSFPDKMVPRHPDCVIIVTANTFGHGGTEDYVGRLKQDKAFLNRFVKVDWEIDETLERETCGNEAWAVRVQGVRHNVQRLGIKVLITPRQSYFGAALLASGMTQERVEAIVLGNEMTADQWKQVR